MLELLAALVARSLVVAEEHGLETRYRLLETIRQYGGQRLGEAGRRRVIYADVLARIREHAHDPNQEVFWAVRLNAEQDNPLAAWSWAIGTGNAGTAFAILAGFAPSEVWVNYPLLLPGSAALEPPGAEEHRGYPLALAVSALFASIRADVTGAEKLWRRAAGPLTIGQPPQAREYGPGGTFWSPGKGLHRMDHQAGAVTIHVYWPPARAIGIYDLQRGQLPVPTACTTSHPALYQALHPPAAGDPASHGAVAELTPLWRM